MNKQIQTRQIITVKYTTCTYAVVKRKLEKIQACRDLNPDVCDTGAAPLTFLSWLLNWFKIVVTKYSP